MSSTEMVKKALLVGNGVTSQLIREYRNDAMMKQFLKQSPDLLMEINKKFDIFRVVINPDMEGGLIEDRIIEKITNLEEFRTASGKDIFREYFEEFGLKHDLNHEEFSGIESLLKVVSLLKLPYERDVIRIANDIYYNDGMNGLSNVDVELDKAIFTQFINTFDAVFTTNYDYVLDDAYEREVYHLHGGFNYEKKQGRTSIRIIRISDERKLDNPYLIWGIRGDDKMKKSTGGLTFPISFPFDFGGSILSNYYERLEGDAFDEIHIWGYSGQNDKHINDRIKRNPNIKRVYYYCNPDTEKDNDNFKSRTESMFCSTSEELFLDSWNLIWQKAGMI